MVRGPTFTPANTPVVDTLKSRYASTSGEGGLKMLATFFFGVSSIEQETPAVLKSRQALRRYAMTRAGSPGEEELRAVGQAACGDGGPISLQGDVTCSRSSQMVLGGR